MKLIWLTIPAILTGSIGPAVGKPLVTSSEDTLARVCMARDDTPRRIVAACTGALADARLTQSQRAELMVAQGDGYLWQDRFAEAEKSYREATRVDPLSVEAWNGLGWALWEAVGDQAAFEAFDTSLSIDVSVQGLAGKAALARRLDYIDSATAREMLRAALAIDPDYIWAVREVAWSFLEERNHKAAAVEFEAALEIEPRDLNARYGLGRAMLTGGDASAALDLFNDVLMDAPEDFPAQVYRIIALRNLDRNKMALRFADRLIETHPHKSSGYIERGQALLALKRRDEAIATYANADRILGPNNAVLYWYADALGEDRRFKDALQVIGRGIALSGADYSDHLLQSYIALRLEDYPLARSAAEASLATGVEDPLAHYYIAVTLIHDGDTKAGLSRFDQAIAAGLPSAQVGDFASELIGAGKYVEAAALRLKY